MSGWYSLASVPGAPLRCCVVPPGLGTKVYSV